MRSLKCVIVLFLFGVLLCSGTFLKESEAEQSSKLVHRKLATGNELESMRKTMTQLDVVTPTTTVPIINPTTPTTTTPVFNPDPTSSSTPIIPMTPVTNPGTTPMMGNPNTTPTPMMGNPYTTPTMGGGGGTPTTSSGQSWCIAIQSASQTALQVALDYACGYGGADCSVIQSGGSCYNPDTVRDHASYAFNSYYQKNPTPTSCDFGGTAVLTNTDPSTPGCQYPSTSTSSSVLNTTNPSGSTVFGSVPPDTSFAAAKLANFTQSMWILVLMVLIIGNHI